MLVPAAKGVSQLSAGWRGAGQAQLSRDAWGWALLTRWSPRNPAAWLAFLPTKSLHPRWRTLIHWVVVTCQTSTDSLEGLPGCLCSPGSANPTYTWCLTRDSYAGQHPWQDQHSLDPAVAQGQDRVLYYLWKRTFHFASKLLVKSHLTDSRVIAGWAVLEFRGRCDCMFTWQLGGSSYPSKRLTIVWYWTPN